MFDFRFQIDWQLETQFGINSLQSEIFNLKSEIPW